MYFMYLIFNVGKIHFVYLMVPIDFTNDQNTMRRSLRMYFYSSKTKTKG